MGQRAGKMDRRITIEKRTNARDAVGGVVSTWSTQATVWAAKRDVRAAERAADSGELAEVDTTFIIRWRTDLDHTMRVVCDSRTYDITGISELEFGVVLEIAAKAAVT